LEDFWDLELPRVGEEGAKGWSETFRDASGSSKSPTSGSLTVTPRNRAPNGDPFTIWATHETILESHIPRRQEDPDADQDSIVVFPDIQGTLFVLKDESARFLLKRVWLSILGVHIPGLSSSLLSKYGCLVHSQDYWSRSSLRRHAILEELLPTERPPPSTEIPPSHDNTISGPMVQAGSAFGPIKEWEYELLDPLTSMTAGGKWRMLENQDVSGVDVPFARRIFDQLRQRNDPEWDGLSLALEVAIDPQRLANAIA
jgi:hypothetical protein